ncbi:pyruvate dehydrogenase (acetyl-transferring) E1 component subunit alpha [Spiroplasma turonicum]|uniref:Pyruvate dehydrogenase E1 component subunit alpha n=1 Tax=Spiroplasma turonicum TaxID=216946 RepID=A0A0K1P691_9MOLU|nr:pyruvate dehydrogenase (acetyl-transferring) E1 component subunit alpha [Spiroplasma turonicum]AKU79704.1 pyruvate dehydrogenase E1 component subunit alpha [Spiroplasma turonicum]ALX70722.1 pyruvate dehydrogenase E1 component subunit alpha [Spiroplasma turonicum]
MKTKFLNVFDPLKNQRVELMDKNGKVLNEKLMPKLSDKQVIEAYKLMNLSRRQDEFQNKVQRQGRLLSFLSSTGQEASEVGYAYPLIKGKDWFVPGYRNNAAWLTVGMPMRNIMLYWMGNEYGSKSPEGVNSLPPNIIIGSQYSHATGIAFAEKFKKTGGVALTTTGDGGMSEGETYEAMNFAKLHELPVIFVCENNKWAISTPYAKSTKAINIAVKGIGVGVPSIKVDGNDFFAVYAVVEEALDYARNGNGPVLIECDTYRLGAHSSSDNPKIYRPEDEFQDALTKDPLIRIKNYLINKGVWDDKKQEKLDKEQDEFISNEFDYAEKNKNYPLEDVFNFIYAEKTPELEEQYKEAKEFFEKYPEAKGGHH